MNQIEIESKQNKRVNTGNTTLARLGRGLGAVLKVQWS